MNKFYDVSVQFNVLWNLEIFLKDQNYAHYLSPLYLHSPCLINIPYPCLLIQRLITCLILTSGTLKRIYKFTCFRTHEFRHMKGFIHAQVGQKAPDGCFSFSEAIFPRLLQFSFILQQSKNKFQRLTKSKTSLTGIYQGDLIVG